MRLQVGDVAPAFAGESTSGSLVKLSDFSGKRLLLKFYRFAGCPICGFNLNSLVPRVEEIRKIGLTPLVLFHSPQPKLRESFTSKLPFEILADPNREAFKAYGIESSLGGMFAWGVVRDMARSVGRGLFGMAGAVDGFRAHPADFVIDEEGRIAHAHYGRNYADTLDVDRVLGLEVARRYARAAVVAPGAGDYLSWG